MTDTVRTLSALQTLLADNTTQAITPQTIRDMLVSVPSLDKRPVAAGPTIYVDVAGSDSNDGLSWAMPKATLSNAISTIVGSTGYGTVKLGYGTHSLITNIVVPQGIRIIAKGWLPGQGTILQWNGPDDGTYAITTASNTSGADDTGGVLQGFSLQCAAGYTLANGINWRNAQNMARSSDIKVGDGSSAAGTNAFPGIGIFLSGSNAGVPLNAFPGFVTVRRVWSTGNGVNWQSDAGFTSVLFDMCAGDIGSRTTDVFIINNPASGTRGKDGNFIFLGFKSEDNGMPTGMGATANYFTANSDVGLAFIGCSAKKGSAVTQNWINYTATPSSANNPGGAIPVVISNCTIQNISTAVKGPAGTALLAPTAATGGEVFQISHWNGMDVLPKKQYAMSRVSLTSSTQSETVPRWGVTTATPIAGVVYLARITLQPYAYTSVTVGVSSAGSALANAFFGLYDPTTLALLATSSSAVTALQASGANSVPMSYTPTIAQDYYLALLVGSATTMPTLTVSGIGFAGLSVLAPVIAHRHNTTALSALPNPVVLMVSPSGIVLPWLRYE